MFFAMAGGFLCMVVFFMFTSCAVIVKPKKGKLVHQFGGRVVRELSSPGLYFKFPAPIQTTSKTIDLSLQSVTVKVKVKTKDEVFMTLETNIMCTPKRSSLERALFNLNDPFETISQVASEKIKSICVEMTVKEIYASKDAIAEPTKEELSQFLSKNGWIIQRVIVQDPIQSKEIEESSNRVYAARRALEASEVEKKVIFNESVGAAEADAESLSHRTKASIDSRKLVAESYVEIIKILNDNQIPKEHHDMAIKMIEMVERKDMLTSVAKHGSLVVADVNSSDSSNLVNAGLLNK